MYIYIYVYIYIYIYIYVYIWLKGTTKTYCIWIKAKLKSEGRLVDWKIG